MPAAGRCTLQWTTSGTRRCLSMREATASTHRTRSACAAFVDAGGAGCLCAHTGGRSHARFKATVSPGRARR